jgi:hypothetical protein
VRQFFWTAITVIDEEQVFTSMRMCDATQQGPIGTRSRVLSCTSTRSESLRIETTRDGEWYAMQVHRARRRLGP